MRTQYARSPFFSFYQRDDPEVLGHPDEFSEIASAQFRHHACAMNFCGLLRNAELKCNLLIQLSLHNMEKNLVFAWCKPRKLMTYNFFFLKPPACVAVLFESGVNRRKQVVCMDGLRKE